MVHITIEDLTFTYPDAKRNVLQDVNLEIEYGSYVCVCGKSGCGKTTLLRHLKSVLTPYGTRTGSVLFNGQPLEELDNKLQSRLIGFVMQNPDAQLVTEKVWHELAFGLESLGVDKQTMHARVAEMASFFGIQSWFHKDVNELSGGQKQLLNLASIMAMQPSVLILDEPTSMLDPIATVDFLNTVRKINIELGTTIIITEHRLEDIYAAADKVVVLDEGRITALGTPAQVAAQLYSTDDPMTFALPAPVRIYYGVLDNALSHYEASAHKVFEESFVTCPLTVREGRTWLTEQVLLHPPALTALPSEQPSQSESCALELHNLWFRYTHDGVDILKGLNLKVPQGQLFAIVGGNGCGKSTMLKCICGVVKPYRGSISISGEKLKGRNKAQELNGSVALLSQDPQNLFAKESVREDLQEMFAGQNLDEEEIQHRLLEVAQLCDIEHLLDMHPFDLSGGELQRAALAKTLLLQPKLLLLDEPTKGIDSFFKREMARIFNLLKEQGTTIVMVSHDIEFCARYADNVAMLFDGEIVSSNPPRAFFSQNSFYTTAANRMSRNVFANAITDEDVIELCKTMDFLNTASVSLYEK